VDKTKRNQSIFTALGHAKSYLIDLGYKPFVIVLQGSQNYGMDVYTESYQSDIDLKAYVLPSFEQVYSNVTTSMVYDLEGLHGIAHLEVKDIRLFPEMIGKMNTAYLEMLVSEFYVTDYRYEFESIRNLVNPLVVERLPLLVKSLMGMANEKKKAFSHPYPSIIDKIEKYGYDPKQLHHIARIHAIMSSMLNDGVSYPDAITCNGLSEETKDFILSLKTSPSTLSDAESIRDECLSKIEKMYRAFDFSHYPITNASLDILKAIVEKVVKRHLTLTLSEKYADAEVNLIKGIYKGLPDGAKKHLQKVASDIEDTDMVEILRFTTWDVQNHWKK
jgi:hypothetical protein